MLPDGMPCERVKLRGHDVVGSFLRFAIFEERGLGQVQAHGSLQCDSSGAEPTIVMLFGRNDLSIKDAAPKEDG